MYSGNLILTTGTSPEDTIQTRRVAVCISPYHSPILHLFPFQRFAEPDEGLMYLVNLSRFILHKLVQCPLSPWKFLECKIDFSKNLCTSPVLYKQLLSLTCLEERRGEFSEVNLTLSCSSTGRDSEQFNLNPLSSYHSKFLKFLTHPSPMSSLFQTEDYRLTLRFPI